MVTIKDKISGELSHIFHPKRKTTYFVHINLSAENIKLIVEILKHIYHHHWRGCRTNWRESHDVAEKHCHILVGLGLYRFACNHQLFMPSALRRLSFFLLIFKQILFRKIFDEKFGFKRNIQSLKKSNFINRPLCRSYPAITVLLYRVEKWDGVDWHSSPVLYQPRDFLLLLSFWVCPFVFANHPATN